MSCVSQAHRIMIDFFPIPHSFNAMLKPVSLSCGHSGCLVCLRQLTKSTANPKCPMCRREFQASSIAVNIALDHITSELAVECQSQGCDWKGKYARAQAHQKHCPKLLVKCSNDGCAFRETREKMPQHEKSYSKREIPRKDCGDPIVWDSSQEHEQFQCTNATRPCPLGCGEIFPR